MRQSKMIFVLALILVTAAGAALAEPVVIKNGSTSLHGVQTLQLEETWRAGGADDEENFFGLITWVEEGADGLVYVLDVQLCQVNVYDDEGTLVRTLFSEGEGPGEVRQPRDLLLLADGTVGAVQEFPGKIIRVDANNVPQSSLEPRLGEAADGGFVALVRADQRGGTFMVAGMQIRPGERQGTQVRHLYLATVDDQDRVQTPMVERFVDWDFTNFTYDEAVNLPSFFWASALGPDGRVYTAEDRSPYRINVYSPTGVLEKVIEREYTTRKRTDEEKAWVRNLFESAFSQLPFPFELTICDNDSDIFWLNRSLQVSAEGDLWVLSSRGARDQPEGVLAVYDVFAPGGTFDRQVQVACEGDGKKDGVFLLGGDRLMVIKGYVDATATMFGGAPAEEGENADAEPMEIICYRITG